MILSFLNKPFPRTLSSRRNIINNFLIGCFVAFFLIVFQPFHINNWATSHKTLKLAGFGFVSFVVPFLFNSLTEIVFPKHILEDRWKVRHEILIILALLFCIALGNLLYCFLLGITTVSFVGFLNTMLATVLLGIFPIALHVMVKHNSLVKINQNQASLINEKISHSSKPSLVNDAVEEITTAGKDIVETIVFVAENEKDSLTLNVTQLLYVESADNYCNIVYNEDGKLKRQLLRSSLKRLESQIQSETILRCHRTFIVNLKNIHNMEGNAAGYKLSFTDTTISVPVSRNFASNVIHKLKTLN
jgi:hypothetical protein